MIIFGLDKSMSMKKSDLELRIKELELELNHLKSGKAPQQATSQSTKQSPEESYTKFLTLANYIPAHIAYVNIETLKYEYVNDLFEKSFGIPQEKIIGSHIKDIIGEKNYKFALKYINEVKSGKSASYENSFNLTSGKRWIQVNYSPVFDAGKKVIGIAVVSYDITERKRVEVALKESKETAERYLNVAAELIMSLDIEGNIILLNDNGHKLLGYKQGELIGKNWFKTCLPQEISNSVLKVFEKLMNGDIENSENYENSVKTRIGEIKTILWHNTILKNLEGRIIGTLSSGNDITEIKQTESKLKGLSTIVEHSLNEIYVFNRIDLKFMYVNSGALNNIGFTKDEMLTMTPLDIKPKFTNDEFSKTIQPLLTHEQKIINFETIHQRKNGTTYPVDIFLQLSEFEGKEVFVAIIIDITERKLNEKKLLRSEHELKKAQQITHIGSWYLDLATNEVTWTEELYKMYGFDPSLPVPPYTEHMKLFTPESWALLSSSLANTTETGIPYELELQTVRKDGSNGWMWVKGEAQADSNGNIINLWGAAQDISEHKEREKQLEEALKKAEESDRLKSAFLANMSHEIRTPMNGILGFTELLKEPTLSFEEQKDFIQTIEISGERMLNTINNIINVSKIESGLIKADIKATNINDKIIFTYKFFKPEIENKGLRFLYKNGLPTKDAIILTDNEKVYGILTNLIKNAIKFTFDGSIEFGYEKKGSYLEFYVKDTGIGISEKQKEIVFERFRQGGDDITRTFEGSGLGLSISKSYIEMLGGKIWVESQEGKGSTFYFTIPYVTKSILETEIKNSVTPEQIRGQLKGLKILIVEDDEVSYSLLSRVVQKISKEVLHAVTGVEAVDICRNNPEIDLVLMDIRMPQMNGLEATSIIRSFNKKIIIIAQTAYGFESDCKKAMEAGCNDYITKPINHNLLYELIKKYFVNK